MADCSKGGRESLAMHDRRRWKAVYVGSVAVKARVTGDNGDLTRRHAMQTSVNKYNKLEVVTITLEI